MASWNEAHTHTHPYARDEHCCLLNTVGECVYDWLALDYVKLASIKNRKIKRGEFRSLLASFYYQLGLVGNMHTNLLIAYKSDRLKNIYQSFVCNIIVMSSTPLHHLLLLSHSASLRRPHFRISLRFITYSSMTVICSLNWALMCKQKWKMLCCFVQFSLPNELLFAYISFFVVHTFVCWHWYCVLCLLPTVYYVWKCVCECVLSIVSLSFANHLWNLIGETALLSLSLFRTVADVYSLCLPVSLAFCAGRISHTSPMGRYENLLFHLMASPKF